MIGYGLSQCLRNAGVLGPVLSVVTQVRVNGDDPAFAMPSKFVGSVYTQQAAQELATSRGWTVARDGAGWRYVVPSAEPQAVVELISFARLLEEHTTLICGGGGGAPVVEDAQGHLTGDEAVIDKDPSRPPCWPSPCTRTGS